MFLQPRSYYFSASASIASAAFGAPAAGLVERVAAWVAVGRGIAVPAFGVAAIDSS